MTSEGTYSDRPGYEQLWLWFGLSRALFLTLPRAMMHEMPDDWQARMADLLEEWDETFPAMPISDFSVTGRQGNRFVKIPDAMRQYRHPHQDEIDAMRGPGLFCGWDGATDAADPT